jgi:hypothetical protein
MANDIDKPKIRARNEQLERARATLKERFIGIDATIDDLIDAVRIWFLMPQVLTRPVIVNLWGMTGVGKTDLVRQLVKAIDFQDRFCEVELSNGDTTSYMTSVAAVLESNGINDEQPSIVLFDEIQRFNTLNPTDGTPLQSTKFTDFWELLSDGRLAKRTRDDLDFTIREMNYATRELKRRREAGEDVNPDEGIGIWEARTLKARLNLPAGIDELAELTRTKAMEMMREAQRRKVVYEPVDHSKTLVIVSGNLDDAFSMATLTNEADVDADIFYAFTEKITVVDIKGSLSRKFKPEQVARFGNIHLIYTSLRKRDFEALIEREVARVVANSEREFAIAVSVSSAVNALIYRNGVFPVQGVRPVFSSVIDVLESNLSKLLFEAIMREFDEVSIDYDVERRCLIGTLSNRAAEASSGAASTKRAKKPRTITLPYVGRLDRVRQRNVDNIVANVSVHEAGHAVAYATLFGLAPLQLTSRVASSYASGFTFPHQIHETRDHLLAKIQVFLAGGIAEDIVFGEGNATVGRANDREVATQIAIDYVRRFGFDPEFQSVYTLDQAYSMDKDVTDGDIEKMITRLAGQTHELLGEHEPFLRALAAELRSTGKLDAAQVSAIASGFGVHAEVKAEGYLHIPDYAQQLTPIVSS